MAADNIRAGMFQAEAVLESTITAVGTAVSEPIKFARSSFNLIGLGSTHEPCNQFRFRRALRSR